MDHTIWMQKRELERKNQSCESTVEEAATC